MARIAVPHTIDRPPGTSFARFIRLLQTGNHVAGGTGAKDGLNRSLVRVIDFESVLRPCQRREERMTTKTNVKAGLIIVVC